MKKFLLFVLFAVIGAGLALGSAANEGGTVAGAWVGVVYATVFSCFVALVENQAFGLTWKEIGRDVLVIIGGSILGALAYTIF